MTNVPWIITAAIGLTLPVIAIFFDQFFALNLLLQIPPQIILGVVIIFYLLILAYVIENFLFWYFNIYIVTNQHLVDVNFLSLLNRDIVEVELIDVESQRAQITGTIRPVFNYGTVIVETAAERLRIEFIDVPKPDFVADRIQDLSKSLGGHHNP